jgi:hypothetical protein
VRVVDENKSEIVEEVVKKKKGFNKAIKVFWVILIIVICLSIVFGLLLSLDVFSDDCDGYSYKSRTSIEVFEVREEYKDKGDNFVKKFNSSEDILSYIQEGEYDAILSAEEYYFLDFYSYFDNNMRGIENYLINKLGYNQVFMYNTIFVKIDGVWNPLIHFTPNFIYVDVETFENAKPRDIVKTIEVWIDSLYVQLGLVDGEIIEIFNEFQYTENSVAQIFIGLTFNTVKKPVIYLYPEKEIELNVILNGVDFTTTYPKYENGWKVVAKPDGTLLDMNGREYNYLYWEGKGNIELDVSKGFVIEKENYIEFLEEKLDYVGLTNKESADFISYWLPYMNEFEYCLVSFQMENYEEQVKLDFSIKPDNELRLFVAFKGLDEAIDIEEQDLSYYADFKRDSFVVVEWGGSFIK